MDAPIPSNDRADHFLLSTRQADGSGIYAVIDTREQLLDFAKSEARLGTFQGNGIAETDLRAI
jgi:hypothetical protein